MTDTRCKDWNWNIGTTRTWDSAQLAVLMDIRDELKRLNNLIGCYNFRRVPDILDGIRRNTAKPRKRKAKAKT